MPLMLSPPLEDIKDKVILSVSPNEEIRFGVNI